MDTTTDAASAAVVEEGVLRAQMIWHLDGIKHAQTALPAVQQLLEFAKLRLQDMDALAVSTGPGSFTGLRIGITHICGLANVLDIPVYAASTLDALNALAPSGMASCAMLDARRGQVYVKCVLADGTELIEQSARPFDEVVRRVSSCRDLYVTGDAVVSFRDELASDLPDAHLAPEAQCRPSAAGVCACVFAGSAEKKTFDTIHSVYLRKPQAERERLERLQRNQGSGKTSDQNPGS